MLQQSHKIKCIEEHCYINHNHTQLKKHVQVMHIAIISLQISHLWNIVDGTHSWIGRPIKPFIH